MNKFFLENFTQEFNIPEKSLIIFDEVDKGFDLKMQVRYAGIIQGLVEKRNATVLCVSHTLVPILFQDKVYDFERRELVSVLDYTKEQTNHQIVMI